MTQRYAHFAIFLSVVALAATPQPLQAQDRDPMTLDQIVRMIGSGVFSDTRIITLANENCLAFRVNDEAIRRLVDAGGSEALVEALGRSCVRIPQVVTYVTVNPAELQLRVGANAIVRATALSPDSSPIAGVNIQWSVADTGVADVSAGGTVLGKRPGRTRVVASTLEGPSGSAELTVVRRTAATTPDDEAEEELPPGAKSVGTATALGVFIPGGGEFYTGNTTKGLGIVVGSAAAVVASLLISSEDTIDLAFTPTTSQPTGPGSAQVYTGDFEATIDETSYFVVGAAVAGALWAYGLVDGILAARKSRRPPAGGELDEDPGLSLQVAPIDGVRVGPDGTTEITLIRIGS